MYKNQHVFSNDRGETEKGVERVLQPADGGDHADLEDINAAPNTLEQSCKNYRLSRSHDSGLGSTYDRFGNWARVILLWPCSVPRKTNNLQRCSVK
jgi:hypothetical protein